MTQVREFRKILPSVIVLVGSLVKQKLQEAQLSLAWGRLYWLSLTLQVIQGR